MHGHKVISGLVKARAQRSVITSTFHRIITAFFLEIVSSWQDLQSESLVMTNLYPDVTHNNTVSTFSSQIYIFQHQIMQCATIS